MHDRLEAVVDRMRALPQRARSHLPALNWGLPSGPSSRERSRPDAGSDEPDRSEDPDTIDVVRHRGAWGVAVGSGDVDRHFPTESAALGLALDLGDRTSRAVVIHGARAGLFDRKGSRREAVHVVPHGQGWGLRLGEDGFPDRLFRERDEGVREARAWGRREGRRVVVHPPRED